MAEQTSYGRNDSGQAAIWLLNGNNVVGGGLVSTNPGSAWHVKASGDFNGDGRADILWQNDSGQAAIWLLNGNNVVGGGLVSTNPGSAWHVKASGDFNGDGKSDILWQNDSGQAALWLLNGNNVVGGGLVSTNPGSAWHIKASGDFNGDGKSDILWQNDSGQPALWLLNGNNVVGGGLVSTNPGSAWHVKASGDFQRRWQIGHPLAERQRSGGALASEREQRGRWRIGQLESGYLVACYTSPRLRCRRPKLTSSGKTTQARPLFGFSTATMCRGEGWSPVIQVQHGTSIGAEPATTLHRFRTGEPPNRFFFDLTFTRIGTTKDWNAA
jgi:hypothetical protein